MHMIYSESLPYVSDAIYISSKAIGLDIEQDVWGYKTQFSDSTLISQKEAS